MTTTVTYQPISRTIKQWTKFVEANRSSDDAYAREVVRLVEAAIVAACDRCQCTRDMLPFNLPGQQLTIDVPVPPSPEGARR